MMKEPLISRKMLKRYGGLDSAKNRHREGIFVAEGTKCVLDLSHVYSLESAYATAEWAEEHPKFPATVVEKSDLKELTRLVTIPPVIAFFRVPQDEELPSWRPGEFVIALDRIQDPGNLGTIIRTADWMGVNTIVASIDTVDAFNPKTVQATMGALASVKVYYTDLTEWLRGLPDGIPVYGTFLEGENIFLTPVRAEGVAVMGNEGQGISDEVEKFISQKITIPSPPGHTPSAESLNVATATAMVLARRSQCIFSSAQTLK